MKKILLTLLLSILFQSTGWAKLNIVTTTSDLGYLAHQIGGERVSVKNLARGDQDVHFLDPKPSFVLAANKADLFIHNGLDLEVGWVPVLLTQSRNPKIQNKAIGHLDASEGVSVIEIPTGIVDRSMGDVHPNGNPHYIMDPRNALIVATHIAKKMGELDPTSKEPFETNLSAFTDNLKKKIAEWERLAMPLKSQNIITYHKTFNYLMQWLGIKNAGYLEPKPGLPPTSAHLVELINKTKTQKIRVIATESYYDPKPGRELSAKTGVKSIVLPGYVNGVAGTDTYEQTIEFIIKHLLAAQ